MAIQSTYWGTAAELEHIAGLGTFSVGSERIPRAVWLQRYLAVASLREDGWPGIDKAEAITEATRLLRLEERKASRA